VRWCATDLLWEVVDELSVDKTRDTVADDLLTSEQREGEKSRERKRKEW
jgi:hypothetical protein